MYIRTKNRIYKVESETFDKQGYYIDEYEYDMILKRKVIKQADTIEELCDEFVGYFECFNISHYFINEKSYDELKREVEMLGPNYIDYGAIWTDKGLIFVAKMNDKGEFELI